MLKWALSEDKKNDEESQRAATDVWQMTAGKSEWHLPPLHWTDCLPLSLSAVTFFLSGHPLLWLPLCSLSHIIHSHIHAHTNTHTTSHHHHHTHIIPASHSHDFPTLPFSLHRDVTPPPHTLFLQGCLVDPLTSETLCLCSTYFFPFSNCYITAGKQ